MERTNPIGVREGIRDASKCIRPFYFTRAIYWALSSRQSVFISER